MEITKQLFEDILSGKLKGTFVLRNKRKISSNKLICNNSYYSETHPYRLFSVTYTSNGLSSLYDSELPDDIVDFIPDTIEIDPEMYSYNKKDIQFMEHFINGHHMKENELTIEIPDNKVVDWDESKKQNKIVLKDRQLTYEDVCKELFKDDHYAIAREGYPIKCCSAIYNASNATTAHQLDCLLAKNMLANVAKYLNDEWKPSLTDLGCFDAWVLYLTPYNGYIGCVKTIDFVHNSNVMFKSKELAQQAIEILGKETVKLALEPLGI